MLQSKQMRSSRPLSIIALVKDKRPQPAAGVTTDTVIARKAIENDSMSSIVSNASDVQRQKDCHY